MTLKQVVEDHDSRAGRLFDLVIQVLILISLVSFCIETLPDLAPGVRDALHVVELVTVVIFTLEYLARLVVADRRLRYVLSFFGLVDLLAIAPFYFQTGMDLRSVRAFRLLRLVRILKLARYNRALQRMRSAFAEAREELVLYVVATAILMFLSSVGIYYCEADAQPEAFRSVFDAMWWSVETFTTVGYGDIHSVTAGGKVFTFFVLLLGLGLVAVPSAVLASALTSVRQQSGTEDREQDDA